MIYQYSRSARSPQRSLKGVTLHWMLYLSETVPFWCNAWTVSVLPADRLGVLTSDAKVSSWAESEGIPILGTPEQSDVGGSFDYLFSVANLTVLPDSLIGKARIMAINFHDGPLPDRAGSNVPAWAIIEGARSHAITWHAMIDRVDGGGILAVRRFEIRDEDTAFSLNAACYEAGLAAFGDLLDNMKSGDLHATPHEGTRRAIG